MHWLNADSGAIQAVSTVVLVVVTIIYAITAHLARTSAAEAVAVQRQDAVRPVLTIELRAVVERGPSSTVWFAINIANRGAGSAFNLQVGIPAGYRFDPESHRSDPGETTYQVMEAGNEPWSFFVILNTQHRTDYKTDDVVGALSVDYVDVFGNGYQSSTEVICAGQLAAQYRAAEHTYVQKVELGPLKLFPALS